MPEYYVPEVIEDLTSKQVLTTELIEGTSLDKIENPDKDTINKVLLTLLLLLLLLTILLQNSFWRSSQKLSIWSFFDIYS